MDCRPLEIKIIKANDIKDVNFISKMDVFAVVSISGDQLNNPHQKTPIDKDGGTNPEWNHSVKFTVNETAVNENRLTLRIKIVSDRNLGDKEIGVVSIQIKELFDTHDEKHENSGTYGVRMPNGKTKGTLDLSYKFGETFKFEPPPQPSPSFGMKTAGAPPVMAYPPQFGGSSSAYPYAPPQQGAYQYAPPPQQGGYPYAPPPQGAYQYAPPPQPGYGYGGYPAPGPAGYGYPPAQKPKKSGGGMALGIGAGLLGGLLVGDMISDAGDMAAYDAGYDAGFGDGGF